MKKAYLLIIFAFILAASLPAAAQTVSPAETRARELVQLINAGNKAEFKKYVEATFNARMLGMPMNRHMDFFSSVYDGSRGYEISGVQDNTKPNQVTMLLKNKLTGEWDALLVAVEPEAPNRIAAIGFRNPKPPGDVKKISEKEAGRELEAFLKKLAGADVFSGAVLLAKDGVPVYKGAFGLANKDFDAANRIDTKFNLGSMNKMFTAVSIAQLVEKGKLSFEDPLSKFIPDFPDKDSAAKIKIKHLLTHTAGLGGYFSDKWAQRSRGDIRTVDDMMALAKEDEKTLLFEPGSKWQYSNTGMLVLGKVIEIVSGVSYYDYVRENITKPAGMTNTDCYELDKVNHNLAVGYDKQYTDAGTTFDNNIFMHVMRGGPQGGGYSTVEDLLRFDQALRSGKLVGADYVKMLTTAKPELNSPDYGFGFQINPGGKSFGHSGGFPGINSNLDIYPGSGWTAIVMSNYSRGGGPVIQKMRRLIDAISQ